MLKWAHEVKFHKGEGAVVLCSGCASGDSGWRLCCQRSPRGPLSCGKGPSPSRRSSAMDGWCCREESWVPTGEAAAFRVAWCAQVCTKEFRPAGCRCCDTSELSRAVFALWRKAFLPCRSELAIAFGYTPLTYFNSKTAFLNLPATPPVIMTDLELHQAQPQT